MTLQQTPSKNSHAEMIRILIPVIVIIIIVLVGKGLIKGFGNLFTSPFKAVGLMNTEEQDKALQNASENISALENSDSNPFNPSYLSKLLSLYGKVAVLTPSYSDRIATQIKNAIVSIWSFAFFNDAEAVFAAIKKCETKSQVSYLTTTFAAKYNTDLLSFLQSKFERTDEKIILGKIVSYVNSLPSGGKNKL